MAMNTRLIVTERMMLLFVLALGAGLRFHNLGVPSMWWDEVLVPLICRFPCASILEWLRNIEVHPPLYYLLTKLVMSADSSDLSLRLLSVGPGVLSIYIIYQIGKDLFGSVTGLMSAGFLAVNPYAVWLSRLVRPYSLFLFFFLLSLWFLEKWIRHGNRKFLWGLIVADLVLFWTHYMMVILAPAIGLVLLGASWRIRRDFWVFCSATAVSFATIFPFFMQNFKRPHWIGENDPWLILSGVAESTQRLIWFFRGPVSWVVICLAMLGLVFAARKAKGSFWTSLTLAVVPVGSVVAAKLAWTHEPRYFVFLMPLALLAAGLGVSVVVGSLRPALRILSSFIIVLVMGWMLLEHGKSYYSEDSLLGIDWIHYKTVARMIPPIVKLGEPVITCEEGLQNALDWYLERQNGPNPIRNARLSPNDEDSIVNFLWFGRMGHLAATKQELASLFPGLVEVGTVDKLTFYKAVIHRNPVHRITSLPWECSFSGVKGFLGECQAMDRLVLTPYWGGELGPGANDAIGMIEYAFENNSQNGNQKIEVSCRYACEGQGNLLRVLTRFDEEPWSESIVSLGPDRHFYRRFFLMRDRPYKHLNVRVEMSSPMITAQYPGGNLGSMKLKELLVAITPM
jgi:hypothetical protein